MTAQWGEPVRRTPVDTRPSPTPPTPRADLSRLIDRRMARPTPGIPEDPIPAVLVDTEESQ